MISMSRWLVLALICIAGIGALMTFDISLAWVGHLYGDFSFFWKGMEIFVPVASSLIFSFIFSVLLALFVR